LTIIQYGLPVNGLSNYSLQLDIDNGLLYSVSYVAIDNAVKQASTAEKIGIAADEKTILQFKQYFENPKIDWKITFTWDKISDFQQLVLQYLDTIPLGTTKTYGQVAKDLQTSARAVGNACRRNPFPIVFPCHRVVAQNGLGGYDGDANDKGIIDGRLAIKYFLLRHESAI
jgi:O-6-methylguanine DNA methyltransferase